MRAFYALVVSIVAFVLAACSGMPIPTASTIDSAAGTVLRGTVHGGQNPIVGAHVYLYAINSSGYGGPGIAATTTNASLSLLRNASNTTEDVNGNYYVTTDQYGSFTITGDYSCPSNYTHTYFYASGGDPGLGYGANSAITLTAPAEACNATSNTYVNEVSTVATAYAFAGFASDPLHVSSSNSPLATTGLANAATTLANLEDLNKSIALATTPAGNGTVPQQEINTLANILAACINSTGPTSTQCSTLFSNATNNGVNAPDTATAALNIAHYPGLSSTVVANLFSLQTPNSPFQPSLPSTPVPNDFTIAISYSGGGLNGPLPVVIDKNGDVWVGNTATGANSVSEFSPAGAPVSGSPFTGGGITDPYSMAIDKLGAVWTANVSNNSLSQLSSVGVPNANSPYTGGGLNTPYSIAFDLLGHSWVVNNVGQSLSEFSATGTPISTTGDTGAGIANPIGIAVDALGNLWVSDSIALGAISEFQSESTPPANPASPSTGFTGGGLADPWGIAVDPNGNVWTANSSSTKSSISLFGAGGSAISSPTGYTGGGLNVPEGIAIDGAGNVWVANRGSTATSPPYPDSSISEFSSVGVPISPSTGYQAGLNLSLSLAVDGSGNLWTSNYSLNTVSEFVGAATPVVTPIVANILFPYGARAVNRP